MRKEGVERRKKVEARVKATTAATTTLVAWLSPLNHWSPQSNSEGELDLTFLLFVLVKVNVS